MEAQLRTDERTHLRSTDIARHENQRFRKVHFAVIAQGQRSFVQDPEKKVPERITRLLDFIEQNETELHSFCLVLIESILGKQRVGFAMTEISGGVSRRVWRFHDCAETRRSRS